MVAVSLSIFWHWDGSSAERLGLESIRADDAGKSILMYSMASMCLNGAEMQIQGRTTGEATAAIPLPPMDTCTRTAAHSIVATHMQKFKFVLQ